MLSSTEGKAVSALTLGSQGMPFAISARCCGGIPAVWCDQLSASLTCCGYVAAVKI
jgi:hypothetical protein